MQRILTSLTISILCLCTAFAQNISVASFSMLENDLTANTQGTIVYDQNGEKCALIKVETTQTGFTFDAGSLGVVKTEQHTAEVWVYVPEGVKRLTISHPQLGIVRDYDLGVSVQKAKTYLLKLTTGKVTTVVEDVVTSQFLIIRTEPANAMVMVNDDVWNVFDGVARKWIPFGTYTYSVMAQDYFPEVGQVSVNRSTEKTEIVVVLKPNFTTITL